MSGRGPQPSPNARRRNKQPTEEMAEEPVSDAPKLFKEAKYCTATKRWWKVWCDSPQAHSFIDTDWERLQMLAPMVEAYHQGELKWLPEIRLNEERLGATVQDRQKLRMTFKKDDEPKQPTELPEDVPSINKYRQAFGE